MSKRQRKTVLVGVGNKCPKCFKPMTRYEHTDDWNPKENQPYYFRYWDKCDHHKHHIQLYETAKVFIGSDDPVPVDELTERFREKLASD